MNPYNETFAKFYDRYFGDYAERASPVLLRFFASKPVALRNPHVLDLGCGTGRLSLHFLEAGYSVTGLDLSPDMLALAERRCMRHMVSGKARFHQGDMADFHLGESFGLVLSTYNSMNHLESEAKLAACFRSVLPCVAEGGVFLFDYHTAKGLREWNYSESAEWEEGSMKTSGEFDEAAGKAVMRLSGKFQGVSLEEALTNFTFPLRKLEELLRSSGFEEVSIVGMEDLNKPLENPEDQKRIVVIAS